jgi:YrbI family 3-deoxy-D-manno-octulosonate 8-phosphate phosphatase
VPEPYNAPRQILPTVYWQTGHIDAIRPDVILKDNSMTGSVIYPLIIEPRYTVDIDNLWDWQRAEWLVYHGGLDMVLPGQQRRSLPMKIDLLVLDFDGVLTDNRVWVDQNGHEAVAANRSDSLGLNYLREAGVESIVISTEVNPVVTARCNKMKVPVFQGVWDKAPALKTYLDEKKIDPLHVVYLGNDTNDIPCFDVVGCAVVVADAQTDALHRADLVLTRNGGMGAVRELCDMILNTLQV